MLRALAIVSILWLIAVVSISSAVKVETLDNIDENPTSVKAEFTRRAMEISDLLRMFISLIKRADEEEGREFGLPEMTTTSPLNLETASLQDLFDRFETAAQSFRTRFLKYLQVKETSSSILAPTISTVVEVNNEEDLTKYVYDHEDVVPNPEMETRCSSTTKDIDENNLDSSSEKSTFVFSPSNAEISEFDTDYITSTIVPETMESDATTLTLILSNEEMNQETEFSSTEEEAATFTLVPLIVENSESFDETSAKPYQDSNNPDEQVVTDITFDLEELADLNTEPSLKLSSENSLNGFAKLLFDSTTEDSEIETKNLISTSDVSNEDVTITPFITIDDASENYTLMPFITTEDSDDETLETTTEKESVDVQPIAEDSVDETEDIHRTDYFDDDYRHIDDSDDQTVEIRATDSDDESVNIFLSSEDSGEEIMEIRSTPDSDKEIIESSSTEENKSDEEEITSFMIKDTSSINEMAELVKILREAAETYNNVKSGTKIKLDDLRSSEKLIQTEIPLNDKKSFKDFKQIPINSDPSTEYLIDSIVTENLQKVVEDDISLKNFRPESEEVDNMGSFSDRLGFEQKLSIFSQLDDVIGVPGENYPNFTNFPTTSFTCEGRHTPGFYADLETRCQVFHACWPLRMETYICPVGTTFHQEILSCDYWFNSTCSISPDYYDVNLRLVDYQVPDEHGLYEYFDEKDIYPYNFRIDHSHPIFNEMKFLPFMYKIINYSTKGRGIESGSEIDYNKTVEIEFDTNSTAPTLSDLGTTEDSADFVKDSFRELLRALVESELAKKADSSGKDSSEDSSEEDSSIPKSKLLERNYVYEKMSKSKLSRSGVLSDSNKDSSDVETSSPQSKNQGGLSHQSKQTKNKEQIAPAIVFKVLETAENVVNKGILPLTRDLLAANYIKLYKNKKL